MATGEPEGENRLSIGYRPRSATGFVTRNYTVLLPVHSDAYYHFGKVRLKVRKGQYLLLNRNRPVEQAANDSQAQDIELQLDSPALDRAYGPGTVDKTGFLEGWFYLHENRLGRILSTLLDGTRSGPFDPNQKAGELVEAIVELQGAVRRELDATPAKKWAAKKDLYNRLIVARELIEEHGGESLRIHAIASAAAISDAHFLRAFKKTFGVTPYQHYLQFNLRAKMEALVRTDRSLKDIAFELGYDDYSVFCRLFRKFFGAAPSDYRKRL